MPADIRIERVYDSGKNKTGYRVLVDRLWPRGVRKEDLKLDEWLKDLAPSNELRNWFNHDPARWEFFRLKYLEELKGKRDDIKRLRALARKQPLILLYGAKDEEHNQAVVLREALMEKLALAHTR